MARLEVNSNDLDLLEDELDTAIGKVTEFTDYIAPGFDLTKKDDLYSSGFRKIVDYETNLKENLETTKKKVRDFHDEIENVERVYSEKFATIKVPKFGEIANTIVEQQTPTKLESVDQEVPASIEVPTTSSEATPIEVVEDLSSLDELERVPLEDITEQEDDRALPIYDDVEIIEDDVLPTITEDIGEVPLYNMSSAPFEDVEKAPGFDEDLEEQDAPIEEEDELSRLMRETEEANNVAVTEAFSSGVKDTMSSMIGGEI